MFAMLVAAAAAAAFASSALNCCICLRRAFASTKCDWKLYGLEPHCGMLDIDAAAIAFKDEGKYDAEDEDDAGWFSAAADIVLQEFDKVVLDLASLPHDLLFSCVMELIIFRE